MYLARFCLVNCLLTLVRSHKCHEWNHRELIAIVETWSCWQKKKEPESHNNWTINGRLSELAWMVGWIFLGVGKLLIKRLGFFLLNLPLSKAIWAHIFIVLKYKQLWEDSCAQICRYFFLKLNFIYGTCKLWQIFFGKFQFCSAFNWADHVKTLLFLPLTTTTIIIIITMPQFL